MAFYEKTGKPNKEQKKKTAEMRGGFEDEGSRYSGKGTKPPHGKPYGAKPVQGSGQRKPFGDRQPQGESKPFGQRKPQGDNKSFGERKPFGDRKPQGENKPFGDRKPYGENKPFGERQPQGEHKPYGEQKSYGEGKPYGDRGKRPYGERAANSGRPGRPPRPGSSAPQRKQEGEYRFAKDAGQRYSDRGAGTKPRPFGEQREDREQRSIATRSRFYAPREARPLGATSEEYRYAPPVYEAPRNQDLSGVQEHGDAVPPENLLSGRNPIREALKSGRDLEKLLVARGELSGSAREIVQMAKEKHIPVQEVDRVRLDTITHNHQGMLAFASAYQYHTLQDMLDLAKEKGQAPFLVLLDGITDPHNLGAIIRTAECAGAHGVIVQERRAVGLTPAAVKASAGAVEYLPVARVTNLTATLMELKAQNIWTYAADMEGEDYTQVDFSGPLALVIGAEGEGVSHRVLETCDKRVSLPIRGQIDSLNASVAAGVLLYAAMRGR